MNELELMLLMSVVCIVSLAVAIVFALQFNRLIEKENGKEREAQKRKEAETAKAGCKHTG